MTAKIIPFPTAIERRMREKLVAIDQYSISELADDAAQKVISNVAEAVWEADEAGKSMCMSYTSFQITNPSLPMYAESSERFNILSKVNKALKEQAFDFEVGLCADKYMISYLLTVRW